MQSVENVGDFNFLIIHFLGKFLIFTHSDGSALISEKMVCKIITEAPFFIFGFNDLDRP